MSDLMLFLSDHAPLILVSIICVFAGGYFSGTSAKSAPWFRDYMLFMCYELPRVFLCLMLILGGTVGFLIGYAMGGAQ